jgi:gliding motility-associated-like protein
MPKKSYLALLFLLVYSSLSAQTGPAITIVPSNSVYCTGKSILFTAQSSTTILSYSWSVFPNRGVTFSDVSSSGFLVSFPKDLTYTVSLSVTAVTGTATAKLLIPVNKNATSVFNASLTNSGYPTELVLTNYSGNAQKFEWHFSDQLQPDTVVNTQHGYAKSGNYFVKLFAYGTKGCNDTSTYAFRIADSSSVVMPNVFTPNGDGMNDIFRPRTTGLLALSGWIYTREGVLLYNWSTVNGYWDGRTTSGEPCTMGEYVAIIEATGFDGKTYKMQGMVSLFR